MANGSPAGESPSRGRQADAQRNRETVLAAAAEVFVSSGVDALQPETDRSAALHACFLDRLLPVCAQLLDAAVEAGDIRPGTQPYELMRGIGNLCIGHDNDPRHGGSRGGCSRGAPESSERCCVTGPVRRLSSACGSDAVVGR
ncbi:hypothetical protein OG864_53085 [Streptomyces sp. NBC_00124]|uniref:hypothetical protein n=1 Tax=Streptomyces sp. NBC_00124 TaxID=2975662 RepID=UPI00225BADE0|nr:hypothetical protein [Streptomyces sp. NBC_00124]MCX5367385.1 hypothetical protein [Streptomyces sp. NBC_00124]